MNDSLRMQPFLERFRATCSQYDGETPKSLLEQANVRLIYAIYEALSRQDVQALRELLAEDVSFEFLGPPHSTIAGNWQGRDDALAAAGRNFAQFADQYPELEFVVARQDTVIVVAEETGRYLPTNSPYNIWWLQAFVIRDGKVVRIRQVHGQEGPWAL